MNRSIPYILLVGIALPATALGDDPGLDEVVSGVEAFYGARQDFSAEFEQKVIRAHLPDRPVHKKGRVYFKKPGKMRWDYTSPEPVYYVSDGDTLWNYVPESNLAYRLDVKDSELFYALRFLYGDGSLARDFDLEDGGLDDGLRVIVVKPKKSEQSFQVLRLFVSPETYRIERTELTDPAGNLNVIRFVQVSYQELPDAGFQFQPPDGVQVEDLSNPK